MLVRLPNPLLLMLLGMLSLSQQAFGQPPGESELAEFADIFIALSENARPIPARGSDAPAEPRQARRESIDIVQEHGWTLERYNRIAHQVNSVPEVWARFRELMEQRSCAGMLQNPPGGCD